MPGLGPKRVKALYHDLAVKTLPQLLKAAEGHVVVRAPPGATRTDPALADAGRTRRNPVTVTHFLLVPQIVAASDLIATLPERVAERMAGRYPLAV